MASERSLSQYRQYMGEMISSASQIVFRNPDEHQPGVDFYIERHRLYCGIIDAMTPTERGDPSMILDDSRVERIAHGSGTTAEQVVEFVNRFVSSAATIEEDLDVLQGGKPSLTPNWMSMPKRPIQFAAELCKKSHAGMLAGTCPWCGWAIISHEQT